MLAPSAGVRPSGLPNSGRSMVVTRGYRGPVPESFSLTVRPAVVDDAEAIRAIYNYEVEHTTATFDLVPRTLDDQRQWLSARSGAFAALVATPAGNPDEVVGFASLSPYKERAAYRTTVENSVYVRRDAHGQGIGKFLLEHLLEVAEASGFHSVMARIEHSGTASMALHRSCGFELVGVEREVGRKFNRWLSVALMQFILPRSHPTVPRL
jgi:L-amino acid N-acyltransferase